jgi:hypothetical protein
VAGVWISNNGAEPSLHHGDPSFNMVIYGVFVTDNETSMVVPFNIIFFIKFLRIPSNIHEVVTNLY